LAKKGLGTLRGRMEAFLRKAASGKASVWDLSPEGRRMCLRLFPEAGRFPWVEKGLGAAWASGRIALAWRGPGEKRPFTCFEVRIAIELFSGFVTARIYPLSAKKGQNPCNRLVENLMRLWFSTCCDGGAPTEERFKPNFVKSGPCRLQVRRFGALLRGEFERIFKTMSWQFNYKEAALHVEHWIRSYNRTYQSPGYPNFGKSPWKRINEGLKNPGMEWRGVPEVEQDRLFDGGMHLPDLTEFPIAERENRRYVVKALVPPGWGNGGGGAEPQLFKKPYVVRMVISPVCSGTSADDTRRTFKAFLDRPDEHPLRRFLVLKSDDSDPTPLAEALLERNELFDILETDSGEMGESIASETPAVLQYFEGHGPAQGWIEWANRESIRIEPI